MQNGSGLNSNSGSFSFIEVKKASYTYWAKKHAIFSEVSFCVSSEEGLYIDGVSGSGKSTLALAMSGLLFRSDQGVFEGKIILDGVDISSIPFGELSSKISYVGQDPDALITAGTVFEEVAFGLENLCFPVQQIIPKVEQVLAQVGLLSYKNTPTHQLSLGQKQRLVIAAHLAMGPRWLILDEPTAYLDFDASLELYQTLRVLKEQFNLGLILIEHRKGILRSLVQKNYLMPNAYQYIGKSPSNFLSKMNNSRELSAFLLKQNFINNQNRLDVSNFSYHYPEQKNAQLDGIDFSVEAGQFLALWGRNGSGKTTLLQAIRGLLPNIQKHSGIRLFGRDLNDWNELTLQKMIGFLFQNPEHQFLCDTVFDEVRYGFDVLGQQISSSQIEEFLDVFQLSHQAQAFPLRLSHGEKRRLSFATIAGLGQPLLLLDEPTFGQDEKNVNIIVELILSYKKSGGMVICATHDLDFLRRCADRVMVLSSGKMDFLDTKEVFLKSYQQVDFEVYNFRDGECV